MGQWGTSSRDCHQPRHQTGYQEVPGIEPPTDLDTALAAATELISPKKIAGKLANAVGQVIAHHIGLTLIAQVVGDLTEQVVTSMPFPANPIDKALNTATISTVAYDLHNGELTA